ncbi:MAG: hypothetical protein HYR66_09010 [Sphingobacteriales bacterium]|nr:hypothetical protein [Sphingobacteriales bacterium]MBI3720319.1 hypothetical protein [Sphingobacteriales bacterium]
MKIVLLILGIYILYRFIFGFVLPVVGATRQMRRQMNAFREQHDQMFQQQTDNTSANTNNNHKAPSEDYLDFEEVK